MSNARIPAISPATPASRAAIGAGNRSPADADIFSRIVQRGSAMRPAKPADAKTPRKGKADAEPAEALPPPEPLPQPVSAPPVRASSAKPAAQKLQDNKVRAADAPDSTATPQVALQMPGVDRPQLRGPQDPSAITSTEMSETIKELWLGGQASNVSEVHVSFSDRLWPVSQMVAFQQPSGKIALQISAPAYDVRRVEAHLDQLRKRLGASGISVESIHVSADGDVLAPIRREPQS